MSEGTLYVKDSRTSREYQIPIHHNTIAAADIGKIKGNPYGTDPAAKVASGLRIYDPSLEHTGVSKQDMTWIDSENGKILFRGYSPAQLQTKDFEDVLHLLCWRKLPSASQRSLLRQRLATALTNIPDCVFQVIRSFPPSSTPMAMVIAGLTAFIANNPRGMTSHNPTSTYHKTVERIDQAIVDAIAAVGVVVAIADCHQSGARFTAPSVDKTFYENLFTMMGRVDPATGQPDPKKLSCFRRWGNAIMDHGNTNSTFALRVTASSLAEPLSALISAMSAGCGLLHFGAQEAAYRMVVAVGRPENVPSLLDSIKNSRNLLYGVGHRSYKNGDPRIAPVRELLEEISEGQSIPYLDVAEEIDRLTAEDEYFVKRRLRPNADLYGQFFYVSLGWSSEWNPILTFVQRLPGFMAHWRQVMTGKMRLLRPTELYIGQTEQNRDKEISML